MPKEQVFLSSPAQQERVHSAWKKFTRGEPVNPRHVPPHVLHGWELSRNLGVDPFDPVPPTVVSKKELAKLPHYQTLLDSAEPMLRMLEVSIRGTGYIATLALTTGHLISVVGDDELMSRARELYNIPGALRSLDAVGTSAISMCIGERRALQVTGHEHYCRLLHQWKCAAAPIYGADDEPIGSLAISSHISRKDIHTLTLTKSCADGISIRLRENSLLQNQQRLNAMLQSVLNALPEEVITIQEAGAITHTNHSAGYYDHAGNKQPLAGKTIEALFTPADVGRVREILRQCKAQTAELEVNSKNGPQNRLCRFVPILLDNGLPGGMTVSITTKSQIIDIAKHVGGNYAKYSFSDIKGKNPALQMQVELAKRAAPTGSRILLTGESGTGKELFAQAIHNSSSVRNGPFVAISCAAIPRDLVESELFGYVGGTFTGARKNGMIGKIELAGGGTLFLDEVNSLPFEMQAKLLRALQQREIVRIGDTKPTAVDVRVIAATNVNLMEAMRQGTFREDLYYRLNVVEIIIPPLRERKDDISLLTELILHRHSTETGLPAARVTPEAFKAMRDYSWPGNVRELDNVCERALLLSGGNRITLEHLPPHIAGNAGACLAESAGPLRASSIDQAYHDSIVTALELYQGNLSKAADHLGVARSTLYRKMRKLDISWQ